MKIAALYGLSLLCLTGCRAPHYQRFVPTTIEYEGSQQFTKPGLVPPVAVLALDSKTGDLCLPLPASSDSPWTAYPLCSDLRKKFPD